MNAKLLTLLAPLIAELERVKDKMKGYNDMKRELKKICDMLVKIIPEVVVVVVRTLGTTLKKLKQRSSDIGIDTRCRNAENYHLIFCKDPPKCS